jgi:hypothetical protein
MDRQLGQFPLETTGRDPFAVDGIDDREEATP